MFGGVGCGFGFAGGAAGAGGVLGIGPVGQFLRCGGRHELKDLLLAVKVAGGAKRFWGYPG